MAENGNAMLQQFEDTITDIIMVLTDVGVGDYDARVPVPEDEESPVGALCIGINDMIEALGEREREAIEAREKAETLSNQSVLALYVLQDGLLKYVNPRTIEMLGYSEEEIASWQPGEFLKVIHEDDRSTLASVVEKKQAGDDEGMRRNYQWRIIAKDGSLRWVETYGRSVMYEGRPADYVTMLDISDRKQAERQLEDQSRAIREMSTPVIKLWEGVVMLPLVGTIDTLRATQMTEALLGAVAEEEAAVVVLDVTGVAVIDTSVARHLLQAVDSAKILGADVIITGFSPVAAQTLAQLGVDFSALRTRGSLRAGVQEALRLVGMKLVSLKSGQ